MKEIRAAEDGTCISPPYLTSGAPRFISCLISTDRSASESVM